MSRWILDDKTVDEFVSGCTYTQDVILDIKKFISNGKGINENSYFNKDKSSSFYVSDDSDEDFNSSDFSDDDLNSDNPIIYKKITEPQPLEVLNKDENDIEDNSDDDKDEQDNTIITINETKKILEDKSLDLDIYDDL